VLLTFGPVTFHDIEGERADPRCSSVREHCRELRRGRFGKSLPRETGQI
jgi:hypothetical protein